MRLDGASAALQRLLIALAMRCASRLAPAPVQTATHRIRNTQTGSSGQACHDPARTNRTAYWPSRRQGCCATQYRLSVPSGLGGLAATISLDVGGVASRLDRGAVAVSINVNSNAVSSAGISGFCILMNEPIVIAGAQTICSSLRNPGIAHGASVLARANTRYGQDVFAKLRQKCRCNSGQRLRFGSEYPEVKPDGRVSFDANQLPLPLAGRKRIHD